MGGLRALGVSCLYLSGEVDKDLVRYFLKEGNRDRTTGGIIMARSRLSNYFRLSFAFMITRNKNINCYLY